MLSRKYFNHQTEIRNTFNDFFVKIDPMQLNEKHNKKNQSHFSQENNNTSILSSFNFQLIDYESLKNT